jgi:transposase
VDHVAIDLGGRESQICVRSSDGKIVEERRIATAALVRYLEKRAPSRVIVETCTEAFAVADAALSFGHEVRVVPSTLVRALGVGQRGLKYDRRDARVLSEASCRIDLPSVHVPSKQSRQRKTQCGMREALVQARTQLINTVRGWMRAEGVRIRSGKAETLPLRVREQVKQLPSYVERQLLAIDALTEQIDEADRELSSEAKKNELCRRLMTVPGVGPVTSLRFAAALDEISRFDHAHAVESYLGLVPGEHSSSEHQRRLSITKAGSPRLRWALTQAAWSARRCRGHHPMVAWSLEVERRRGKAVAVVALARKIAGVLYAIWRDGTTYQAERGAAAPTETAVAL